MSKKRLTYQMMYCDTCNLETEHERTDKGGWVCCNEYVDPSLQSKDTQAAGLVALETEIRAKAAADLTERTTRSRALKGQADELEAFKATLPGLERDLNEGKLQHAYNLADETVALWGALADVKETESKAVEKLRVTYPNGEPQVTCPACGTKGSTLRPCATCDMHREEFFEAMRGLGMAEPVVEALRKLSVPDLAELGFFITDYGQRLFAEGRGK